MWAGLFVQQNDVVRQHSWLFGFDGALEFLQNFHVPMCVNSAALYQKVNEQRSIAVKKKLIMTFPKLALDLFGEFEWLCFHCWL